jgi:hypothetical protein
MKFLEQLTKKKSIFQRSVGLSLEQFKLLAQRLGPYWVQAEEQRKKRETRRRKIGGGHPYKFMSIEAKLLVVLLYYKLYLTQEFLGVIIGLDQANVSRLLQKMLLVIELAADPELAKYVARATEEFSHLQRINNWQDFWYQHPDLRDVSTDATEQKCFRSQDYEKQKKHYSGKTQQHSLKVQLSVSSLTGRILDVSKTYPGSVHDKNVIDQENTVHKFPKKTPHRLDSGYQGLIRENPDYYIILPLKKPREQELCEFAKELNRVNSRRRVVVENCFARLKKFMICGNLYRGPIESHNQIVRNVASLLNFRLNLSVAAI